MIMMYKILNSLDGLPFDDLFSFHHTVTRTNGYKLYKNFSHLNCRKYFFSQRVIEEWNHLPREIIESSNIWIFKSKLDVYWYNHRFKYNLIWFYKTYSLSYNQNLITITTITKA